MVEVRRGLRTDSNEMYNTKQNDGYETKREK